MIGTNKVVRTISDDGTYIYIVEHAEALSSDGSLEAVSNSWVTQIHRSGFPSWALEPDVMTLFYAYASDCYLDSAKDGLLDPIKTQPSELRFGSRQVRAWTSRKQHDLGLPEKILFLDYAGEVTNLVLQSEGFTNVADVQVPMGCSIRLYNPHNGAIVIGYEFLGEAFSEHCSLRSFTLEFPRNALVSDYRFSHGEASPPAIVYASANEEWPTEEESKKKKAYAVTQLDWEKIQRAEARGPGRAQEARSMVVRIVLMSLLAGGVAITVRVLRSGKHSFNRQNDV